MFAVPFVNADVTPENSHPLPKCIKIVNLDEFSDIYFIGYITGPMVENYETYMIEPDKCLTMGYKFNTLKILAAKKSYVDSVGINNIDISNENVFSSDEQISPYGGYVDENNPLIKLEIEYSILGFSDDKLILYKSKETSEYNDGTSTKVETFEKPNTQNLKLIIDNKKNPEQNIESKSFWSKINCFFKGIFGRSC